MDRNTRERRPRRGQRIGTNVGALIADVLVAKSYAAGDRRTEAQRAHVVDWSKRGRAFRSELIAAGVLLPPGYTHERTPVVLEIDHAAIAEAAREIFFDSAPGEGPNGPYNMAEEVATDPASDLELVDVLYAWREAERAAAAFGDYHELERPAPAGVLPAGYEHDYYEWCDEQKAARRADRNLKRSRYTGSTDPDDRIHRHGATGGQS